MVEVQRRHRMVGKGPHCPRDAPQKRPLGICRGPCNLSAHNHDFFLPTKTILFLAISFFLQYIDLAVSQTINVTVHSPSTRLMAACYAVWKPIPSLLTPSTNTTGPLKSFLPCTKYDTNAIPSTPPHIAGPQFAELASTGTLTGKQLKTRVSSE